VNDNEHSPLSLKLYYKSLGGLSTAIASVVLPFISAISGSQPAVYLFFPPLGSIDWLARLSLVFLGLLLTVVIYFWVRRPSRKSPQKIVSAALGLFFLSLLLYLASYQRFVRSIAVPSQNATIYVSVGYERTPFAVKNLDSQSDWEMLRSRGTDDEAIHQLWTARSIVIARLTLFSSCAFSTLALLFAINFTLTCDLARQCDLRSKELYKE
jgi:hypothetical protein